MAIKKLETTDVSSELPVEESQPLTSPFSFEVVKNVTRKLLKPEFDKPIFINIQGEIYEAAPIKGAKVTMEPPFLAEVVDLETGEEMQMIFPKVLKDTLLETYSDSTYVGKNFRVIKYVLEGKKYHGWSIAEIAVK